MYHHQNGLLEGAREGVLSKSEIVTSLEVTEAVCSPRDKRAEPSMGHFPHIPLRKHAPHSLGTGLWGKPLCRLVCKGEESCCGSGVT